MKNCLNCHATISTTFTNCPICSARQCDIVDNVSPTYPSYTSRRRSSVFLSQIRKWTSNTIFVGAVATIIINIIMRGAPWSACVVLNSYLFQRIFLSEQLIDTSPIKRSISIVSTICLFILTLRFLAGIEISILHEWQYIIVVILIASVLSFVTLHVYDFRAKTFKLWA